MQSFLLVLLGVVLASAYFLLKTRRMNPRLEIDLNELPSVDEGMTSSRA